MSPIPMEVLILEALTEGPTYGLGLVERIRKRTRERVQPLSGTLYPALKRLCDSEFLTCWEEKFLGRDRTYYKLTPVGEVRTERNREEIAVFFGWPHDKAGPTLVYAAPEHGE